MIYEYAADRYGLITSSEAKKLGIPNVELVKLAHRGRIRRLGYGVYKIVQYIPTTYDKYAEAIALVGNNAIIYGESVLAMHDLALVNPTNIYIAVRNKVRKKLPTYIKTLYLDMSFSSVEYEGISSQSVFDAIMVCRGIIMSDRLYEAVGIAKNIGLITDTEARIAKKELK